STQRGWNRGGDHRPADPPPMGVEARSRAIREAGRGGRGHQANRTGGFGAEVAAELAGRCFASLDAPVSRIASPDVPAMPFSPALEHAYMLNPDKVADGLRRVARYGSRSEMK